MSVEDTINQLKRELEHHPDIRLAVLFGSMAEGRETIGSDLDLAVQLCVAMSAHWLAEQPEAPAPKTMGQGFDALAKVGVVEPALAERMKKAVGFRNVMVHSYDEIDWAIVYAIGSRHLDDFKMFARAILAAK